MSVKLYDLHGFEPPLQDFVINDLILYYKLNPSANKFLFFSSNEIAPSIGEKQNRRLLRFLEVEILLHGLKLVFGIETLLDLTFYFLKIVGLIFAELASDETL